MAAIESNGLFTLKDAKGNLYIVYPITKKDNIEDLSEVTETENGLMISTDKKKLDGITYRLNEDADGVYMESI